MKTGLLGLLTLLVLLHAPLASAQAQPQAAHGGTAEAPGYAALADILENEGSRQALIDELRALQAARGGDAASEPLGVQGEVPPETIAAEAPSGQSAEQVSFARRLAEATANVASNMGNNVDALLTAVAGLTGADQVSDAGPRIDSAAVTRAAIHLAIVIVGTFVVFFVLRAVAAPIFRGLSRWCAHGSEKMAMLRTLLGVLVAAVVDLIVVALAYTAGGLIATFMIGESGTMETRFSLFLNAFLIVELVKAALRMVFAARYDSLRLMPVQADQAHYVNRFLANLAGWIGYGMLVLVPIINFNLSPALGASVGTLIMLVALLYAAVVVIRKRAVVRHALFAKAEQASGPGRLLLRLLGRTWHLLALVYALIVFGVTVINPDTALPFVALATLKTLIYAGVGMLVAVVLGQLIGKEIVLSERLNTSMPRLQTRVNLYVPTALKVIRALILILVVLLSLDAWQVYDLAAWYATEAGAHAVAVLLHILLILIVAGAIWIGLASLIEQRLSPRENTSPAAAARAETLLGLFHTTLAITIIIMTVMIVLSEIGINIGPLIAGAGVLGLAVGFGAQKLVQDVITGVFIQLENAMNTGDFVSAGGNSGTVERVGIRSVSLRDLYGTFHIIPFSSVDAVSNFTREYGNHVGEYGIGYRESIDDAIVQLEAAFEELKEGPHKDNILAPMTVAGVTALADSSVNIRVVIKTTPGNQWAVGRAYNRLVKIYFDKAGIEIPFPHTTLYFGEDRDGKAPPANIRVLGDEHRVVDTQNGDGDGKA
ncbi:mechanosensitive ion channel protein MscS [Alcanivorax sp. N3-2A]|nr:mechanosensitive ion channel protein MscS [Alcanivorax sp. N3-2A]